MFESGHILALASNVPNGEGKGYDLPNLIALRDSMRLASEKTRKILDWTPTRYDILEDTEHGSYAV